MYSLERLLGKLPRRASQAFRYRYSFADFFSLGQFFSRTTRPPLRTCSGPVDLSRGFEAMVGTLVRACKGLMSDVSPKWGWVWDQAWLLLQGDQISCGCFQKLDSPMSGNSHMSCGQYFWQGKRTWIPMCTLHMALLIMRLTLVHMET